jgi:hypothetical protein
MVLKSRLGPFDDATLEIRINLHKDSYIRS